MDKQDRLDRLLDNVSITSRTSVLFVHSSKV